MKRKTPGKSTNISSVLDTVSSPIKNALKTLFSSNQQNLLELLDLIDKDTNQTRKKLKFSLEVDQVDPDNPVFSIAAARPQVSRDEITLFFKELLSTPIPQKPINITWLNGPPELNTPGRESVSGSSKKQMRHVTPYGSIKNLLELTISDTLSTLTFIPFIKIVKLLTRDKEGYSFSNEDLEDLRYKELAPIIRDNAKKRYKTSDSDSLLLSPQKLKNKLLSFTPTKEAKAQESFTKTYPQYIETAINRLAYAIKDQNTTLQATERLAEFIFKIFNSEAGVAFPSEGNTQDFEIRLYENSTEAEAGKKNYEVISAKTLQKLSKHEQVSGRIRLVDCEGSDIAKVIKSLKALSKIIKIHNDPSAKITIIEAIEAYNDIVTTLKLVLANSDEKYISEYNEPLDNVNYLTKSPYHLAKLVYFIFDFKALEEIVLIPNAKGKIQLYKNAKSDDLTSYSFSDGAKYRSDNKKLASKGNKYNKTVEFRDEKTDLEFLEHKLVEHFLISTVPYKQFPAGFKGQAGFLSKALDALINLVSIDYSFTAKAKKDFLTNTQGYYKHLIDEYVKPSELDSSCQLMLKNDEGHEFSNILGDFNADDFYAAA